MLVATGSAAVPSPACPVTAGTPPACRCDARAPAGCRADSPGRPDSPACWYAACCTPNGRRRLAPVLQEMNPASPGFQRVFKWVCRAAAAPRLVRGPSLPCGVTVAAPPPRLAALQRTQLCGLLLACACRNPFAYVAFKSTEPWLLEYVSLDMVGHRCAPGTASSGHSRPANMLRLGSPCANRPCSALPRRAGCCWIATNLWRARGCCGRWSCPGARLATPPCQPCCSKVCTIDACRPGDFWLIGSCLVPGNATLPSSPA